MKLIYLWVEDYKNIQKQGFNFSPRFECKFYDEYDEKGNLKDNCKLEIQPKEHIENFFGDNINVTAIVGKNGSGKSSVLHSLIEANDVFFSHVPSVKHKFIMCYIEDGKKVLETNIDLNNETKFILEKNEDSINENDPSNPFHLLHYDSSLAYFQRYWNNKTSIATVGDFTPYKDKDNMPIYYKYINLVPNKDISLDKLSKEEKKYIIYYMMNKKDEIINTFFEPSIITVSSFDGTICDSCSNFEDFELYSLKKSFENIIDGILKIIDKKSMIETNLAYKKKEDESLYGDYSLIDIKNKIKNSIDISSLLLLRWELNNNVYIGKIEPIEREIFKNRIEDIIKYIEISKKTINKNKLIYKENKFFQVNLNLLKKEDIPFFFKMQPHLKIHFIDEKKDLNYENLSNGEKELLRIRFYIEEFIAIQIGKSKNIMILLDEPNNNLHPNWQKIFLNYFIGFFKNKRIKVHLIFTTHSPFLISDIPKQNIIFLDTYKKDENDKQKEGNCKVVDGLKQTFGANIHTLLSDSFFMEDGLMGEFAKGKIMQIKKFHKKVLKYQENKKVKKAYICFYNKKQKKFEQIQSIIGEPFLKTVIKNYLDEIENILFDDAKVKEMAIERLVKEFDKDDIMRVLNG